MDFSSDFLPSARLSQTIESDSENDRGTENKHSQEDSSSPVFRRQTHHHSTPSSPVFCSGKRKQPLAPAEQNRDKVVRSLNSDFLVRCQNKLNQSQKDSRPCDGAQDCDIESGHSSMSGDLQAISVASSQVVSSCPSSMGAQPQPIEDRRTLVTASSFLANLEEEGIEDDMQENVLSDEEEQEALDSILNSNKKKRKPVKCGLLEHFNKLLQQKQSKEHLEKYQNDRENFSSNVSMKLLKITKENDVLILSGCEYDLVINMDFCEETPSIGDTISFCYPRTNKIVDGRKVLFGVFKFTIISKSSLSENEQKEHEQETGTVTKERNLQCPCQSSEAAVCHHGFKYFSLPNQTTLSDSDLPMNVSKDSEKSFELLSPNTRNSYINLPLNKLVEKLGGTTSSPQSSFTLSRNIKFSCQLNVHRVFFRRKQELADGCYPTLLCEDAAGEFALLKFDEDLENDPNWRILYGNEWESLHGVKMTIKSPFHIQSRITRSQNVSLFSTIHSIRGTDQRFCYVFKCFPGSLYSVEGERACGTNIDDMLSDSGDTEAEQRVNCRATLLHFSPDTNTLYAVIPSVLKSSPYHRVVVKTSFVLEKFLKPDTSNIPSQAVILGIMLDKYGDLHLDGYSSIIAVTPVSAEISFLPTRSSSSNAGDLVRIEGMVTKVDEKASLQWMECNLCKSDELEQAGRGWRCGGCGQGAGAELQVELVCTVGGQPARLTRAAKQLLPPAAVNSFHSFHPVDVIGLQVPAVMGIVGEDGVAEEC